MHDVIALDFFWTLFFLLVFGSCIVDKTQFIFVVNGEFIILNFSVGLQNVVNNLLAPVWWGISEGNLKKYL